MKMLKKHGKKVSVILLAMALAVTPMLPIVKAADDDTCQIVYHYYFIEGENAWIDTTYTAKTDSSKSIEVGTNYQSTLSTGTKAENTPITIVQRNYTNQYAVHFGITTNTYSMSDSIFPTNNPYIKVNNNTFASGVSVTLDDNYSNTKQQTYDKKTNLTMTSLGEFYNYQLPDGYEIKSSKVSDWDDEDWNIFSQMYVDGIKAADKGTLEAKDLVHSASDKDYYFVHFGWSGQDSNNNDYYNGAQGEIDLKNSDTTSTFSGLFASWANDDDISKSIKNSSKAQAELKKIKAASFNIPTVIGVQNSSDLGDPDLNEIVTIAVRREYGDLDISDITPWATSVNVANDNNSSNVLLHDGVTVKDTYHWYFFPKKLDVTFEGSGDVCTVDTGVEPGAGETNNKYGVASYAIIGTLLVGAASAYIYARKSNKFNKI